MPNYLVLYRSSVSPGEQMSDPEQAQAGMELWMTWATKAGEAIGDLGAPVAGAFSVGKGDLGQPVCGFSILKADSPTTLTHVLEGHPHLQSPGDPTIEVLEFLPMPGA